MEQIHPLVTLYQQVILGFEPLAYAKMNERGAPHKYTKIYRRLTPTVLRAHLRGDITIGTCLINQYNKARAAVLDIDQGGIEALSRTLAYTSSQGLHAFAISSDNEEHSGGHVWLLFAQWNEPARLRQLAENIAIACDMQAETYPTRKAIRLPFGIHRWTGKRGMLFVVGATPLELDSGNNVVHEAIRRVSSLPLNHSDVVPQMKLQSDKPLDSARENRSNSRENSENSIRDYNHATDIIQLLQGFGGRIAEYLHNGGALMHCPCPFHKHADARASIEVRPTKNKDRYGDFIIFGYVPGCVFYTERGQVWDAFSAYCKLHGLEADEAIKRLHED